jgi:hypothetical protein
MGSQEPAGNSAVAEDRPGDPGRGAFPVCSGDGGKTQLSGREAVDGGGGQGCGLSGVLHEDKGKGRVDRVLCEQRGGLPCFRLASICVPVGLESPHAAVKGAGRDLAGMGADVPDIGIVPWRAGERRSESCRFENLDDLRNSHRLVSPLPFMAFDCLF